MCKISFSVQIELILKIEGAESTHAHIEVHISDRLHRIWQMPELIFVVTGPETQESLIKCILTVT